MEGEETPETTGKGMGGGERSGGNGKREEEGERRKEERGTGLIVGGHVIEFAVGEA